MYKNFYGHGMVLVSILLLSLTTVPPKLFAVSCRAGMSDLFDQLPLYASVPIPAIAPLKAPDDFAFQAKLMNELIDTFNDPDSYVSKLLVEAIKNGELTESEAKAFRAKFMKFVLKELKYISEKEFQQAVSNLAKILNQEGGPLAGTGKVLVHIFEPEGKGQKWITALVLAEAIKQNPGLKDRIVFVDIGEGKYAPIRDPKLASYPGQEKDLEKELIEHLKKLKIESAISFDDFSFSGSEAAGRTSWGRRLFSKVCKKFHVALVGATERAIRKITEKDYDNPDPNAPTIPSGDPTGDPKHESKDGRVVTWRSSTMLPVNFDSGGFTDAEKKLAQRLLSVTLPMLYMAYKVPDDVSIPRVIERVIHAALRKSGFNLPYEPYKNPPIFKFP